jgi:hypothetical protein
MTMAENAPDQTPAATPPVDYRPQPRYGELAPEGWTWTPPQDERTPVDSAIVTPEPAPAAVAPGRAAPGSGTVPGSAPTWDRPVTLSLLVLGVLGAFFMISVLGSMPEALQMLYTQAGLGDYTAADSVGSIITAASIGQGVLWLATATVSVMLLLRGRRAFYVPIVGGVVAFVLLVAAMAVVLAGDPALLDYFIQP